jgi:hypothetical protein
MRILTNAQREAKRKSDRAYVERNREAVLARARISSQKRRDNGKTAEYESRPERKEMLRLHKEKARRAAGAIPRAVIAERKQQRITAAAIRASPRATFAAEFIGPPTPAQAMTDTQLYAWRSKNDPDFYARELDRAQRYKARTRPGYRDSIIKWADMPAAVKEVKHLQFRISQLTRRASDEKNQRAA